MKKLLLKLVVCFVVIISLLDAQNTQKPIINIIENYVPTPSIEDEWKIIDKKKVEERMEQDIKNAQQKSSEEEKRTGFFSGLINGIARINSRLLWKPQESKFLKETISTRAKNRQNKPILLVSLHGTFAGVDEAGQDTKFRNTQAIHAYAQWLADKYGHDVDLLIFQWAAGNAETFREESGMALADVILAYIDEQQKKTGEIPLLFSVTHSWGGAVMQYAAKEIFKQRRINFDLGIQTACPVPHEETSGKVYNFKKLFQFYSTADLTQVLGSTSTFSETFGRKMSFNKQGQDNLVWNVRVQDDGRELNHINIKWIVIENAPALITTIEKNYPYQFDLDAAIIPKEIAEKHRLGTNVLAAVRNPAFNLMPLTPQQELFNISNEKLFEQLYGFSIHRKSNFLLKQFNLLVKSPLYLVLYASEDAIGKNDLEKPQVVIEVKK